MKITMTADEYLKADGGVCPCCRGTNIEGEGVDINHGGASQACTCDDCGAEWVDHYTLAGFILNPEGNA